MKNSIQKGFTLIELLIVIAIIGVLAGILFVSINPAEQINKAIDASIASTLGQVPNQAVINDPKSFKGVCGNNKIKKLVNAAIGESTGNTPPTRAEGTLLPTARCGSNPNTFAIQVTGKTSEYCVDAGGLNKKPIGTPYTLFSATATATSTGGEYICT